MRSGYTRAEPRARVVIELFTRGSVSCTLHVSKYPPPVIRGHYTEHLDSTVELPNPPITSTLGYLFVLRRYLSLTAVPSSS